MVFVSTVVILQRRDRQDHVSRITIPSESAKSQRHGGNKTVDLQSSMSFALDRWGCLQVDAEPRCLDAPRGLARCSEALEDS